METIWSLLSQRVSAGVRWCIWWVEYVLCPPLCAACFEEMPIYRPLCEACERTIQPVAPVLLPGTTHVTVYAVGAYTGALRRLVQGKLRQQAAVIEQLAILTAQRVVLGEAHVDLVVPVPLHWTRYVMRGYNQAEVIARALGTHYNVPMVSLVRKVRRTRRQMDLTGDERLMQPRGAYELVPDAKRWYGKHIVLVDDVMTTGATLRELVAVLRTLRPQSIRVVVAARVI